MRALAGFVIDQCAVKQVGLGGFVTLGFGAAETYLHSIADKWDDDRKNSSGTFLLSSKWEKTVLDISYPLFPLLFILLLASFSNLSNKSFPQTEIKPLKKHRQ